MLYKYCILINTAIYSTFCFRLRNFSRICIILRNITLKRGEKIFNNFCDIKIKKTAKNSANREKKSTFIMTFKRSYIFFIVKCPMRSSLRLAAFIYARSK